MRGPPTPVVAASVALLAVGVLNPSAASGQGAGERFRFLFTPQAGLNAIYLSCGWHSGPCGDTRGPALDFQALGSDAGDAVYFRSFGFKSWGGEQYVAFGRISKVPHELAVCKTTQVAMVDKETYDILGYIRYTHMYATRSGDMLIYVSQAGRPNECPLGRMAKDPSPPEGPPPPAEEAEDPDCKALGYWGGVHLHEYHLDGDDTIFLRDGGDCTDGDRYPCTPYSAGPYNPQSYDDWTRTFCIDDWDCDGWTDAQESSIGTDPHDDCRDDENDAAWPPDMDNNAWVNVVDVLSFKPHNGCRVGQACYSRRYDLTAVDAWSTGRHC